MSDQRGDERRSGQRSLFLVELRAGRDAAGDLDGMQAALRHAVSRLGRDGLAIRWAGSVSQPGDGRCLCLVEATCRSHVDLARDTAGLIAIIRPMKEEP